MVTRFEDKVSFYIKKANQDKMNWTCTTESEAEVQRATKTLGDQVKVKLVQCLTKVGARKAKSPPLPLRPQ